MKTYYGVLSIIITCLCISSLLGGTKAPDKAQPDMINKTQEEALIGDF